MEEPHPDAGHPGGTPPEAVVTAPPRREHRSRFGDTSGGARGGAPALCVVMPVYNAAAYVAEAMRSILAQDYADYEFLIVDNGSTDGSRAVTCGIADPRIRLHCLEENCGPPGALNVALRLTEAPLLARMDADDVALPGRLAAQMAYMRAHPEVALLGTQWCGIDEHGRRRTTWSLPVTERDVRWKSMFNSPFVHAAVCMRRDAIVRLGGYDTRYRYAADFDLWSRCLRQGGRLANLDRRYMLIRTHPGQDGAVAKRRALLAESAAIARDNIAWCTGLAPEAARVENLIRVLDWGAPRTRAEALDALDLFRAIAAAFARAQRCSPGRFYARTLVRFGWHERALPPTKRLRLACRGMGSFMGLPCA
ncbi:MAG: glycosyltransferase [Deltaproteobacteria bacterium]|nr:glycosyltransferase [Deltaproteobacteria bacterium]